MTNEISEKKYSLPEYLKTCSDRDYAIYIISTMCGASGDCEKCRKDALEAIGSRPATDALDELEKVDKYITRWVGGKYVPQVEVRQYIHKRMAELRQQQAGDGD